MNFKKLTSRIQQTNEFLQQNAVKAINIHITLRNWLTGFYIVEFEQNGSDRAEYGTKLLESLAKNISIKGLSAPELSRCRQFYNTYPQILGTVTQKFKTLLPTYFIDDFVHNPILGTVSQELSINKISQSITDQSQNEHLHQLLSSSSYSHLVELIKIDESKKRRFYELLILKTQPSVRELKRQIDALTYERVGLSANHKGSFDEVMKKINPQ